MVEYEKDLSWKNHTPFFINLNKDMDQLRQISRVAKDFTKLPIYYEELENMCYHYACYLEQKIFDDLEEVQKIVMTTTYQKFLTKQLPQDQYKEFYPKALGCVKELREIHSKFSKCLHDHELFPKIILKEKKDKGKALYS